MGMRVGMLIAVEEVLMSVHGGCGSVDGSGEVDGGGDLDGGEDGNVDVVRVLMFVKVLMTPGVVV